MEITAFILTFFAGMALSSYMITHATKREEKRRLEQLLELENNIHQYTQEVNKLRVEKRLSELSLKIAESKLGSHGLVTILPNLNTNSTDF